MSKVDIYKYIESNTLKEYWQKIGYFPDPMACVYLITYNSDTNISGETRKADLFAIANENRNMSMREYQPFVKCDIFNDFINDLIDMQTEMSLQFFSSKNLGTYSAEIFKKGSNTPFVFNDGKLSDLYKHANMVDVDYIIAENYIPAGKYKDEDYYIRVKLDSSYNIVEVLGGSGTPEEDEILHGFMSIYHDFPHPFEVGDYVKCILPDCQGEEYRVFKLPRKCSKSEKHDDGAKNFDDMCMLLYNSKGEKAYIHVHDLEFSRLGGAE